MSPSPWRQVTIGFPDWAHAEYTAVTHLAPMLTTAEINGLITGWFFIRKRPDWRVRYLPADTTREPRDYLDAGLARLQQAQHITRTTSVVYEPETRAFGGPQAMDTAHRLWHLDSRHLLEYLAATVKAPASRRRRELSILLCSAMLRGAGLDWYEQGDVWAQVADHRGPPEHLTTQQRHTLQARVRRLMRVDPHTRTPADGPLAQLTDWAGAFAAAGHTLARLHADGMLHRGLRNVLAHHVIFAANRLGLPATTQATLATAATTTVFGPDPAAVRPAGQPPQSAPVGVATHHMGTQQ